MCHRIQMVLVMILATCVLLMSATFEISAENAKDDTAEYAELFKYATVTPAAGTSCTSSGVFAINCTSYLVCARVNGGFMGAVGTCPSPQNFDPNARQCSSSYTCSSCTQAGFTCATNTSFTLCADAGVVVISNQLCPTGYYCNPKCTLPCLYSILSC